MPQLTHDTADDGFHEIQLSGKQLVFLFMATTVVSVVIFLCGVLVGRSARDEGETVPVDTVTAAPSDDGTPVTSAATQADPPTSVPPAELTYDERLNQKQPTEELKPAPAQEAQPQPEAQPPLAAPAAKPDPEPADDVPTAGKAGAWVIQVHALSNRAAASSVVKRLIDKGYPAFLQLPARRAPAIYRVQIGRYGERREAEQVARRLEKEEQFKPEIKR